ncbi:MAG: 50S ribosomal protein L6 [Candidatus Melainabacteria bacterium]|nr:50S ribosomal protein L6 [Candidatus Melainabacteria bacterium]
MSRVGKNPVQIPEKVEVTISESPTNQLVKVKGPKGELENQFRKDIKVEKQDGKIVLTRNNNEKFFKSLHGTYRTILQNMILGVTQGFKKELDIVGVGYRALLQGNKLVLQVGYSNQIEVTPNKETKIEVDKNQTHITITGIDKQIVGDLSSHIRSIRLPEPYKGKGIKYSNERIRRKVGKSAVKK